MAMLPVLSLSPSPYPYYILCIEQVSTMVNVVCSTMMATLDI